MGGRLPGVVVEVHMKVAFKVYLEKPMGGGGGSYDSGI